jgi:hypothetical protein
MINPALGCGRKVERETSFDLPSGFGKAALRFAVE